MRLQIQNLDTGTLETIEGEKVVPTLATEEEVSQFGTPAGLSFEPFNSTLKKIMLPAIQEQLNNHSTLLKLVEEGDKHLLGGRPFSVAIRRGR